MGFWGIAKYARMIKEGGNIRQWSLEVLADAIIQYTQLALQLANLTATSRATLVRTPVPKHVPTGNRRGRPKATAVIARTNRRVDKYYRRKPVQSDTQMSHPFRRKRRSRGPWKMSLWSSSTSVAKPSLSSQ